MDQKRKKLIFCSCLGVFSVTLMVLFGIYDLQISNAIVQPEHPIGMWLEFFGVLVGPWIFILAGTVCFIYSQKSPLLKARRTRMALSIICILTGIGYCAMLYIDAGLIPGIVFGTITLIAFFIWSFYLDRKTAASIKNLCYIAIIAIIYLLSVLIIINLIKICWGRVRFRDMIDVAQYSPWFMPQGINGHRSFPSGHTANAATLYIIIMFVPLCKHKFLKALCYIVPIVWIVVMAASRVLVGAHYASDVLFGALISIALFYLSKHIVFLSYKKSIIAAKKLKVAEEATQK